MIQEKGFLLGSLRFPTWRDALQADRSLQFLSRYASPHSVEGLKHLVSQTKILDTAYEYMGKKTPTLLQKIELFFRKKNEYSILLRAALNKSE